VLALPFWLSQLMPDLSIAPTKATFRRRILEGLFGLSTSGTLNTGSKQD